MVKEDMKRLPFHKKKLAMKCLFMALTMGVGIWLMAISVLTCREYRAMSSRTIVVEAVISDVVLYTDSENGDDYRVYVTYTCAGEEYTRLHRAVKDKSWMQRVGQPIKIIVDPLNPAVEPENVVTKIFFTMFFGLPIFCAGTLTCFLPARMSCVACYGLQGTAIRKDLLRKELRAVKWLPFFLGAIGETAFSIYAADIDSVFVCGYLLSVMLLPFGIVFLVKYLKEIRVLRYEIIENTYSICRYKVKGKKREYDDETTSYYIYYENAEGNTPVRVSKKEHDQLAINDELINISLLTKKVFCSLNYGYNPERGYYDFS